MQIITNDVSLPTSAQQVKRQGKVGTVKRTLQRTAFQRRPRQGQETKKKQTDNEKKKLANV